MRMTNVGSVDFPNCRVGDPGDPNACRVVMAVHHQNPRQIEPILHLLRSNGYSVTTMEACSATPHKTIELLGTMIGLSDRFLPAQGVWLDADQRRAWVGENEVHLTKLEFDVLSTLVRSPGRVFSREMLIEMVWGYSFHMNPRVVDAAMKRLRKKLSKSGTVDVLETVRGIGYRAAPPPPARLRKHKFNHLSAEPAEGRVLLAVCAP